MNEDLNTGAMDNVLDVVFKYSPNTERRYGLVSAGFCHFFLTHISLRSKEEKGQTAFYVESEIFLASSTKSNPIFD